jgi:hypothetical protein
MTVAPFQGGNLRNLIGADDLLYAGLHGLPDHGSYVETPACAFNELPRRCAGETVGILMGGPDVG